MNINLSGIFGFFKKRKQEKQNKKMYDEINAKIASGEISTTPEAIDVTPLSADASTLKKVKAAYDEYEFSPNYEQYDFTASHWESLYNTTANQIAGLANPTRDAIAEIFKNAILDILDIGDIFIDDPSFHYVLADKFLSL